MQQSHIIVNEILKSIEENKVCTAAFLDVEQAFDRVYKNLYLLFLHPITLYLTFTANIPITTETATFADDTIIISANENP